MLHRVEPRTDLRVLNWAVVVEVFHDRARQHRPFGGLYPSGGLPLVIPRIDPCVPERQRDLELGDAVVVTGGKAVLESVEAAPDLVELSGFVRRRVGREIAGEQLAGVCGRQHYASSGWA